EVAPVSRPPDHAVGRLYGIAGALAERRHLPLAKRDLDRAWHQLRFASRLVREVGGQVLCDRVCLGIGQFDHVAKERLPPLFRVSGGVGDLIDTVAGRASPLYELFAHPVGKRGRLLASLRCLRLSCPDNACGDERRCQQEGRKSRHDFVSFPTWRFWNAAYRSTTHRIGSTVPWLGRVRGPTSEHRSMLTRRIVH